jgi:transketolase
MGFATSVHAKAAELIKLAIEMTTAAGSGHPTSAASLAHLVTVLLYDHMRHDPQNPAHPAADRLVLSEGHACPIVYAAAADLGIRIRDGQQWRPMTRADAMRLREIDGPIDGHPNPAEGFPFFPAATGSLGQGLSIAAGLALAARLDGMDKRIFCIIGDGESREGQIWEAVDFLADYRLDEVCPIFNCNGYGQSDAVSAQQLPAVTAAKLTAAGFDVRVIDGHDPDAIREALAEHTAHAGDVLRLPFAVVARTEKAWGFSSVMSGSVHGKAVPEKDKDKALAAVDAKGREVGAKWVEGDLRIPPVPEARPPAAPATPARRPPTFTEALKQFDQGKALEKGKLAPRKAYGIALRALGHINPQIVALDGDVRNSTYAEDFAADPLTRRRFFECKIAEQNMISCAGGLAAAGKVPFASTFGKFVTRGYDQLGMGLISRFNLKVVGSHVGVSIAADGPSQMALADVAYFRAWTTVRGAGARPALYLLNPADAVTAYALTLAMADHDGACYLRAMRPEVPFLYDATTEFSLGGHQVLSHGPDLLVAATGYMVHECRKALEKLHLQGVHATLVDLYSLPFDGEAVATLARECGGRVLTVEDNYGAGFGSAVADALAEAGGEFTVKQMHVRRIPKSGRTPDDLLRYLGLSADDIAQTVERELLAPHGQ